MAIQVINRNCRLNKFEAERVLIKKVAKKLNVKVKIIPSHNWNFLFYVEQFYNIIADGSDENISELEKII